MSARMQTGEASNGGFRDMFAGDPIKVFTARGWDQISPFRPHRYDYQATVAAVLRGEQGWGAVSKIWDGTRWWPGEQHATSATITKPADGRWIFDLHLSKDAGTAWPAGLPAKGYLQQAAISLDTGNPNLSMTRTGFGVRLTLTAAGARYVALGGWTTSKPFNVSIDGWGEFGPVLAQTVAQVSHGTHTLTPTWIITPRGGANPYPGGPTSHMGENPATDLLVTVNIPGPPTRVMFSDWGTHGLKTTRGMHVPSIRPASNAGDSVQYQVNGGAWHTWGGGAGGVASITAVGTGWHAGANKIRIRPPAGVSMSFGNPGSFKIFQIQVTV